jgi:hypothetical protein
MRIDPATLNRIEGREPHQGSRHNRTDTPSTYRKAA